MLRWIGIAGAVALVGAGVWTWRTQPAASHPWAIIMAGAGLVELAAVLWAARASLPPVPAVPPAVSPASFGPGRGTLEGILPGSLAQLQWELDQARWAVAASEARLSEQELAESVLNAGSKGPAALPEWEKLVDAAFLDAGYGALARGTVPGFRSARFAGSVQPMDVEIRLAELQTEERRLRRDAQRWQAPGTGSTPAEVLEAARDRWERLSGIERRWVEVYLLKMGYQELWDALGDPTRDGPNRD